MSGSRREHIQRARTLGGRQSKHIEDARDQSYRAPGDAKSWFDTWADFAGATSYEDYSKRVEKDIAALNPGAPMRSVHMPATDAMIAGMNKLGPTRQPTIAGSYHPANFMGISKRGKAIANTLGQAVTTVKTDLGINRAAKVNKNSWQQTARYNARVDPRLRDILDTAAQRFPDYTVQAISGYRPGDKRQHGKHRATDIQLVDKVTGKALPNYQDAKTFRTYEKFAQEARRVQQEKYPELDKGFRWGGYFSGKVKNSILGNKGKYGAVDVMHFDLGGLSGLGMLGGSWAKGLTKGQRGLIPGAESYGINHIDKAPLGAVNNPDPYGLHAVQDKREYDRPTFSAPVGRVERGPLSAPTLAGAQRARSTTVPSLDANKGVFGGLHRPSVDTPRNFPGMSVPRDTASPRTMATLGGLSAALAHRTPTASRLSPTDVGTPAPQSTNRVASFTPGLSLNTDVYTPTAPAAIYDDPRALAYAQNMTPQPVDAVLPGIVPQAVVPQTLAQPKRVQRVRQPLQITVRAPRRQTVTAPSMPGGTLGGISAQDRFSVGTGVRGITSAMGGIRGATGFSRSTPGVSVTSRGPSLGTITHNERYQTDTFRDANNNVTGVHLSPGQLGRTLGSIFGGSGSSSSGKSSGSSSGKSGSGKGKGAAGGGLGQSQHSL